MAENKVRFGLKNVHYAVLTEGSTNSWATPVPVPGAVSITIDSNTSDNTFYADNVAYYKVFANNGYSGSLEMARISDAMMQAIWGETLGSTDKILYEKTGVQPKPFALLFEVDGDQEGEKYVFYRVVPTSKPSAGSQTIGENAEPTTQSFDFEALPLVTGASGELGLIKGRTTDSTPTATASGWFNAVVTP